MVNEIYQMKNDILKEAKKEIESRGIERMDVDRIGAMIDMVHHLAEAEASCWQADYYRTVVEAMKNEKQGYQKMPMQEPDRRYYAPGTGGTGSSAGYMPMRTEREGYGGSMGFNDPLDPVREAMRNATPDEREHMRQQLRNM